jgi:hypothetical protein
MFDKRNVQQVTPVNRKRCEDVALGVLGIRGLPCLICSPLRPDRHPSFKLYRDREGEIRYKDFSTGESGDMYRLLQQLRVTNDEFDHILTVNKVKEKEPSTLAVATRPFERRDVEYWNSHGVSMEMIRKSRTHAVSEILVGGQVLKADSLAYVYVEYKDDKPTIKVYQPYSERHKWLSNHDKSVWDLWDMMIENPVKDELIITSSRKDAMCLWTQGYPAVSLQGETHVPKRHVMMQVKNLYKTVHVLYDNDAGKKVNVGRRHALILCYQYNLHFMEIPEQYGAKDPSDLYRKYGKEIFKKVIDEQRARQETPPLERLPREGKARRVQSGPGLFDDPGL